MIDSNDSYLVDPEAANAFERIDGEGDAMINVAVLDDWQGVARGSADWSPLFATAEVIFFEQAFQDEEEAARKLANFEIVLSMRERTPLANGPLYWNQSKQFHGGQTSFEFFSGVGISAGIHGC